MSEPLTLFVDRLSSPVGELVIVVDADGKLRLLSFGAESGRVEARLARQFGKGKFTLVSRKNPGGISEKLRAYFRGNLKAIERLPVKALGTPFQRAVWAELRRIPCGTTISYGELARRIGRPKAQRAVGLANNKNPIGIVVPCHRVIGANGALTGYGGGMSNKRWLLAHEGALEQGS